jgi:DNA-binding LacI/PurR family transcriptional regulator
MKRDELMVTVRDVARAAGVSAGTVSRALKNEPGLTEETRQRICRLADEMGYDIARLRGKRLRRVVFLLHSQHNTAAASPFYLPMLQGAEAACRRYGIVLSFLTVGPGPGLFEQLRMHAPDGIICAGYFEPEVVQALHETGKPLVLIDMKLRGQCSVNPDNHMGGHLATRHLIELGRSRIGLLCGSLSHYSIRERARGFRQALFDAGMLADPRLEVALPEGMDPDVGAWEAMSSLLALPQPPDAVFCFNDSAALVAMRCCLAHGLKVPHDVSIVGFDDIDAATQGHRPLTTLRVDKKALGALGVDLLLKVQGDESGAVLEQVVPVELVVRGSTRA